MRDISIIIVSYNVKALLLQCLKSIYSSSHNALNLEIIVVDNNSKDDSVLSVQNNFPQVTLIANKFNAGFSGANNQGIKIANGKYIFLLNPDTEIIGDAILNLHSFLSSHPGCSLVAPQLLNSDKSIQLSVWKNAKVRDLILETFFLNKVINDHDYPFEQLQSTFAAETFSGAALFFRKELIDEIGMLDENFFWMEDIDFCTRAQKHGQLIYLAEAKVLHHSGQSQKTNYNIPISNQLLSKLKFYRKYFNSFRVLIADIFCAIFIVSRLFIFSILSPFRNIYKLKAKAYFYTLKRFIKYLFFSENRIV